LIFRLSLRILAAALVTLMLVYAQGPLTAWLTPAEHGGVIAASVVGRVLAFAAMAALAGGGALAAYAGLGALMGPPDQDMEEGGCLQTGAALALGFVAVFGLAAAAVVLTWRVDHDLWGCVVAFLLVVPSASFVVGGEELSEGTMELLGGL
jgi:hypothetical protein